MHVSYILFTPTMVVAISDHQDRRRLNEWANRILSPDIKKDIDRILSYGYETE